MSKNPLRITEHLDLLMPDDYDEAAVVRVAEKHASLKKIGLAEALQRVRTLFEEASYRSPYGLTPLQVEEVVHEWQNCHRDHPRFPDSERWLEAYQPEIDAYKKRLAAVDLQDSIRDRLRVKKKETEKEIEHAVKHGCSREKSERTWAALFLCQFSDAFTGFGCSAEESHNEATAVVRELFEDLGYSDEEAEKKTAAAVEAAGRL